MKNYQFFLYVLLNFCFLFIFREKCTPPEAVALFDWFLTSLEQAGVACLMIPGNHDSDERLAFGAHLLSGAGVHFAPVFDGALRTVTLEDAACSVHFTLLPFLRPAQVRRYFPEVPPGDYEAAIRAVLGTVDLQTDGRHVLLAHQFVTALGVAPEPTTTPPPTKSVSRRPFSSPRSTTPMRTTR